MSYFAVQCCLLREMSNTQTCGGVKRSHIDQFGAFEMCNLLKWSQTKLPPNAARQTRGKMLYILGSFKSLLGGSWPHPNPLWPLDTFNLKLQSTNSHLYFSRRDWCICKCMDLFFWPKSLDSFSFCFHVHLYSGHFRKSVIKQGDMQYIHFYVIFYVLIWLKSC